LKAKKELAEKQSNECGAVEDIENKKKSIEDCS